MPEAQLFFYAGIAFYFSGALASLGCMRDARSSRLAGFGCALAGSLFELLAAFLALWSPQAAVWTFPFGVPLFAWTVRLNPLSAFFSMALAIVAAAVSVYSLGYVRPMEGRRKTWAMSFFYNVLLLSLTLVFSAANVFFFLVAWEVMAVSAFCLVSFEHEKNETRRAGIVFLIMSHAGSALLLAGFLVLAGATGSLDFAAFHTAASRLPVWQQGVVFLLFLGGFGVKAGVIPLHVWLPAAHPVAPSNISGLMSGIVIKTGIYGMALVFFDFFGAPPVWAGMLVLGVGLVSGLLGVLYALIERDLKRLLAYSSIENIGIILIGFGAAMIFRSFGNQNLAALALVASLFHAFNHAVFKTLLFLCAGSVLQAAGVRNMEEMGGLIRRMPVTAACFLVGAISISGLPPLNGFVSEWLTYQALLGGFTVTGSLARVVFPIAGALLGLTAALASACFVKAFGISFLALPKSEKAERCRESGLPMQIGMGVLASCCIALGLGATWFLPALDPVTKQTIGPEMSGVLRTGVGVLSAGGSHGGRVSPAAIAGMLAVLCSIPGVFWFVWGRFGRREAGPAWDCGLPSLTAENSYTATGFSKPIRMIFAALFRPRRGIQADYDISPYYPTTIRFQSEIEPAFEKRIYNPFKEWLFRVAGRMRTVQAGSVHAYLAYIFIALIALLIFGVRG